VSDRRSDDRLYEITGSTVGSIRLVSTVVPCGSVGSICVTAELTSSVEATMSWPQPKSTLISALPRLVSERRLSTPGTWRIASSTGRVTSATIWSAGRSPESSSTATRGKLTSGNSVTGSWNDAVTPPIARIASRNRTERR